MASLATSIHVAKAAVLGLSLALPFTGTADASQPQGSDGKAVHIDVINAKLPELLLIIANLTEEQVEVSAAVNTRLSATQYRGNIRDVLQQLSQEENLEWFAFNGVYYVSDASETTSRLIRLSNASYGEATRLLRDAGIGSDSLKKVEVADGAAIVLTGPPKLIAFGEAIIHSLPAAPALSNKTPQIRIRRGTAVEVEAMPAPETRRVGHTALTEGGDS